jgi:RNA polymerase sigma-70 factor (ECF subfamily)
VPAEDDPVSSSSERGAAEARFRRLYEQQYEALLAYAARRTPDRSEAHDVVSETFLILWRRLDEAPRDNEIPLWLYGVARRVLANRRRSRIRRERLTARLTELADRTPELDDVASARLHAHTTLTALQRLRGQDREVLLLAAWENLSTAEIASVLGCSENAAAIRLHRARRRLIAACEKEIAHEGHAQGERSQLRRPGDERRDR